MCKYYSVLKPGGGWDDVPFNHNEKIEEDGGPMDSKPNNFIFPCREALDDEEPTVVRCPACKGFQKMVVKGKEKKCPLCEGQGQMYLDDLLEIIVEAVIVHTVEIGE